MKAITEEHYERGTVLVSNSEEYLFLMPVTGELSVRLQNRIVPVTTTDFLLCKPSQHIYAEIKKADILSTRIPVSDLVFYSDHELDLVSGFDFVPYDTAVIQTSIDNAMLLKNLLHRIKTSGQDPLQFGLSYYESSIYRVFLVVLLRACVQSDRVYITNRNRHLIIDEVYLYIRNHLRDDLTLSNLAEHFFVSREHLSRSFRKATGMGIHEYILNRRIDSAKKYLLQDIPIQEIYPLCGFKSYTHFFRAFRTYAGMTPLQFKKQSYTKP